MAQRDRYSELDPSVASLLGLDPLYVTVTSSSDSVDVTNTSGLIFMLVDSSSGNVIIGGTTGADPNDRLVIRKTSGSNSVTVEHDEGTAQPFAMSTLLDETETGVNKSWSFQWDGSYWQEYDGGDGIARGLTSGADPDISTVGYISIDTDGGNEPNSVSLRVTDAGGDTQYVLSDTIKLITVTILDPENVAAADLIPIWINKTGYTANIIMWEAWSNADNVSFEIEELTSLTNFSSITQVDACEVATDGTSVYYGSDTTITHATIETDHGLAIDYDTADAANYLTVLIALYFDGDVD